MCLWLWLWLWCGCGRGRGCVLRPVGDKLNCQQVHLYRTCVCVCVSVCVCVLVCRPVGDKLLDINDLERFLRENLKVQGKTGNLVHVLYVCLCLCLCLSVFVGGGAGECVQWKLLFA